MLLAASVALTTCVVPAHAQSAASPPGPSYARTLTGTVGGGLVGAGLVGGVGALILGALDDGGGGFAPGGDAVGLILGGVVGYWLGQSVGASWGSAGDSWRVPIRRMLGPAALWTAAGLGVYGLIGDGFDPEGAEEPDLTSWYIGGAVGALVQIVGMSVTAHRMAVGEGRRASGVSLGLSRSPTGALSVGLRVAVGPAR